MPKSKNFGRGPKRKILKIIWNRQVVFNERNMNEVRYTFKSLNINEYKKRRYDFTCI